MGIISYLKTENLINLDNVQQILQSKSTNNCQTEPDQFEAHSFDTKINLKSSTIKWPIRINMLVIQNVKSFANFFTNRSVVSYTWYSN